MQLIRNAAEALVQKRRSTSYADLIASLPQEHETDVSENCWRKDCQYKEAHLLPAKHLN